MFQDQNKQFYGLIKQFFMVQNQYYFLDGEHLQKVKNNFVLEFLIIQIIKV